MAARGLKIVAPLELGIGVRNLERMRRFYEDAIGLAFVSEHDVPADKSRQAMLDISGYRVVRLQSTFGERIKLLQPASPPAAQRAPCFILEQPNVVYLTFIVEDIRAALKRLVDHGVTLLTGDEPCEVRPGTWLVFCRDPEANVLELVQYDDLAGYRPDLAPKDK